MEGRSMYQLALQATMEKNGSWHLYRSKTQSMFPWKVKEMHVCSCIHAFNNLDCSKKGVTRGSAIFLPRTAASNTSVGLRASLACLVSSKASHLCNGRPPLSFERPRYTPIAYCGYNESNVDKKSPENGKEKKIEHDVSVPLVNAVTERGRRSFETRFYVPGHKGGNNVPESLLELINNPMVFDLTELRGLDNLHAPEDQGPIHAAQNLAAKAWNADKTFFLINGSTVGIHASILATCSGGSSDAIILPRNVHMSAVNGSILADCTPIYVDPVISHGLSHHVLPQSIESAFETAEQNGLQVRAVFVVSPTYFGVQSDIKRISEICRNRSAALIVDEAHGAHLHFLSPSQSALDKGADIVIQSTHKTLSAFTQGSMIHVKSKSNIIDDKKIQQWLNVLQSSSPNYTIMASLDAARAQAQDGISIPAATRAADRLREFWKPNASKSSSKDYNTERSCFSIDIPAESKHKWRIISEESLFPEDASLNNTEPRSKEHSQSVTFDPWRLTVLLPDEVLEQGITGYNIYKLLEDKKGIVAELATWNSVVFAVGIGTTIDHAESLRHAWEWLIHEENWRELSLLQPRDQNLKFRNLDMMSLNSHRFSSKGSDISKDTSSGSISPREAIRRPKEVISLENAVGRLSGETLCPYPPGVPLVFPGEEINLETIEKLKKVLEFGGTIVGATDGTLKTIMVCQSPQTN